MSKLATHTHAAQSASSQCKCIVCRNKVRNSSSKVKFFLQ